VGSLPISSSRRSLRGVLAAGAACVLLFSPALRSQTKPLPASLSAQEFWALTGELSEPDGFLSIQFRIAR
jgi:hypothetical protein